MHKACHDGGETCYELSGRVKQLAEWQAASSGILACQIQSGGVGVDMSSAHYCIYYSATYDLGAYLQSLARLDRPGQRHHVTYVHLIAERTVDEKIRVALDKKLDVIEYVLAQRGEGA